MASAILMPQLGLTMEEGTVEEWVKHEGDEVKKGDVLLNIRVSSDISDSRVKRFLKGTQRQQLRQKKQLQQLKHRQRQQHLLQLQRLRQAEE